jgi:hypothetical protein
MIDLRMGVGFFDGIFHLDHNSILLSKNGSNRSKRSSRSNRALAWTSVAVGLG